MGNVLKNKIQVQVANYLNCVADLNFSSDLTGDIQWVPGNPPDLHQNGPDEVFQEHLNERKPRACQHLG